MSENKFTVKLEINNVGPHNGAKRISFSDEVESNKAIFFATNGTGKSFISRAFRLTTPEKQTEPADDLLTLGQNVGSLSFSITSAEIVKKLSVRIEREKNPTIQNETGLIFHVFNSDYVEENIKPRHYSPNGNIEGYVLGKAQIDITKERELEQSLIKELGLIDEHINDEIDRSKKEVKSKGVNPSTNEFGLIEKSRLRSNDKMECVTSFAEIAAQLDLLSKVPEKITDVQAPKLMIDQSVFDEVVTLLTTLYPKTEWDQEFVAGIKKKQDFIEEGLAAIVDGNICPFCGQQFETDALILIRKYKEYFSDKEAELSKSIGKCKRKLNSVLDLLKESVTSTKGAIADIVELKKYFPSLVKTELIIPEIGEDILRSFEIVTQKLAEKADDLSLIFPQIEMYIEICRGAVLAIEKVIAHNAKVIESANETKNDVAGERLSLRRSLCKAQYCELRSQLRSMYDLFDEKNKKLEDTRQDILQKEQKARVSKREKVYETLTYLLDRFFAGKYSIDKKTFQITFLGNSIGNKASNILSDGEKSIVAFCYFLASTHLLAEREDDYNRMFFVIDDPISSMDFNYVYTVATLLREIKSIFGITRHERIWIFTHNNEFLSIIARNFVLNKAYVIKPGSIEVLKYQLLMPYEHHLADIVSVAKGNQQPSHTTANSIRHVLETVSRFEYPTRAIDNYIAENDILAQNSCIYTICQDLSHGGIRNQQPLSAELLVNACQTVVDFMNSKYEGQVKALGSV